MPSTLVPAPTTDRPTDTAPADFGPTDLGSTDLGRTQDGPGGTAPAADTDAELIAAVRAGRTEAYATLYRRHVASARALARQLASCPAEADDLVAEAFTKLFAVLLRGGGPDTAFRAYLLTALRHAFHDRLRRDRRVELSDDMGRHDPGVPWEDPAISGLESRLAARAFTGLPERWRTVLWRTEVEQRSSAEVASQLGLSPNGAAALAYRAREGLRQAYLQEHVRAAAPDRHRVAVGRLGAWVRDGLPAGQRAAVDSHLGSCPDCRTLATELAEVSGALRRNRP
ncbi:MAG TPA: sigma-70 family RNA polymerase sigma factor [Mycobacteriales bacterium]|nr:sigma-70 family RNA polymerase sigma factor [Mycobacteriales bacterium]